mmetsp:Transcript_34942/g.58742  ORF Transcript_34942/g.58742 Transcript_34942/m.58742 type:complete len:200 (+) Transcript_34942:2025-2624(+)
MPAVDHTQPGGGAKLRPIGGTREPLQVLPEEGVYGGPCVHERVGEDGRRVAHRVARLNGILDPLQDEQIGMVVAREKLQVEADGGLAAQDRRQLRPAVLVHGQKARVGWVRRDGGDGGGGGDGLHLCVHRIHGFRRGGPVLGRGLRRGLHRCERFRRCGPKRHLIPNLHQELLDLVLAQVEADLVREQRVIRTPADELV